MLNVSAVLVNTGNLQDSPTFSFPSTYSNIVGYDTYYFGSEQPTPSFSSVDYLASTL